MKHLAICILVMVCSLSAQQCVFSGPADETASDVAANGAQFLPISGSTTTYLRRQYLIDEQLFGNVPTRIRDLAVASKRGWVRMRYDSLQVRVGQTSVTTLSNTFAANITGPMSTVIDVAEFEITWGPGQRWNGLGLQQEFLYVPGQGNLLIDVVLHGWEHLAESTLFFTDFMPGGTSEVRSGSGAGLPTTGTAMSSIPALRLCTDLATVALFGAGCAGSNPVPLLLGVSGLPELGGQATFWMSNALPNGIGLLAFGEDASAPFPIDLGVLGAPGCRQYFAVTSAVGVAADSVGIASHTVHVPNVTSLLGAIVFGQYAALMPGANALGIVTSNCGRVQVGV